MNQIIATKKAVVIGGGIVGVCCALYLQKEHYQVTLIDPAKPGDSTAKWSCGQMAVSEVIPLSKMGILKKIPSWLMDQTGPLALRPSAFPQIIPWFMRFVNCARQSRIHDIANALASLTHQVYQDYQPLIDECQDKNLLGKEPIIELFDSYDEIKHEKPYLELRKQLGFQCEELNEADIADLEPVFAGKFKQGLLFSDWCAVKDTEGFIAELTASFITKGGVRIQTQATKLLENKNLASGVQLKNGQTLAADVVVMAAGTGVRDFFKQLGINVPLTGIGGYQVVLPNSGVNIKHSTIYANGGFCFSPMSRGLQIGGTIEFAAPNAEPNMKRADIILAKARKIIPQLQTDTIEYGVGYRPFLPDTKPIIDLSPRLNNVALAFGHGQLGLTLGATTGKLISSLLTHKTPTVDLSPFSANRF